MTQRKAKSGMSVRLILGIILTIMGASYLGVGYMTFFRDVREEALIFQVIFGGLGIVFLAVGLICLFLEIRKRWRSNRLFKSGNYISAEISEVVWCTNIRINSRHPYQVMCRYQDMEVNVHIFKSRYLFFDPEPLLKDRMVRVYVENGNFGHYYVDIDEVLPNVTMH